MKKLFNYCFYRIALFYRRHIPLEDYLGQGVFLQIFAILLYFLTLLELVLRLYGLRLTKGIAIIFLVPFVILTIMINHFFPRKEELFNELSLKYQHEKHKWIKGLCVFLYIIMSLVCFLSVLLVFRQSYCLPLPRHKKPLPSMQTQVSRKEKGFFPRRLAYQKTIHYLCQQKEMT